MKNGKKGYKLEYNENLLCRQIWLDLTAFKILKFIVKLLNFSTTLHSIRVLWSWGLHIKHAKTDLPALLAETSFAGSEYLLLRRELMHFHVRSCSDMGIKAKCPLDIFFGWILDMLACRKPAAELSSGNMETNGVCGVCFSGNLLLYNLPEKKQLGNIANKVWVFQRSLDYWCDGRQPCAHYVKKWLNAKHVIDHKVN